eukprot:1181894-Prorocentrum_minimum.AAC.2
MLTMRTMLVMIYLVLTRGEGAGLVAEVAADEHEGAAVSALGGAHAALEHHHGAVVTAGGARRLLQHALAYPILLLSRHDRNRPKTEARQKYDPSREKEGV